MCKLIFIGLGSGVGGIARYLVTEVVSKTFKQGLPLGTLTVNSVGSFLIGVAFVFLIERGSIFAEPGRALLLIGFLGGFTTFSAFSLETMVLFETGRVGYALANIALSISCCLIAIWLGLWLARQV